MGNYVPYLVRASTVDLAAITSVIDVNKTEGYAVVQNLMLSPEPPLKTYTVYAWRHGDFFAEEYTDGSEIMSSNAMCADGTFSGTNWTYRNGTLIYYSVPTKEMEELDVSLGGRRPERHYFEMINGRGVDSGVFSKLTISDQGTFGRYQDVLTKTGIVTLSLSGHIQPTTEALEYEWRYKVDGFRFYYLTQFRLQSVDSNHFFPSYLKTTKHYTNSAEVVLNEYKVKDVQLVSRHVTASPAALYHPTNTYFSSNGVLVAADARSLPILQKGVSFPTRSGELRRAVSLFALSLISVGFALWYRRYWRVSAVKPKP